jgi:putative oxidoreductase
MGVRGCLAGAPMPRVRRVLLLGSISPRIDLALLVLRVWVGASLFLRHGLEKLSGSADAISQFPDPLHLGSQVSFIVATCSDGFFSILVVAGLGTRWAALVIFCNIFVAWGLVVHFQFFAHGVSAGEAMVLYLGGLVTIAVAGPGRFSADSFLAKRYRRRSVRVTAGSQAGVRPR